MWQALLTQARATKPALASLCMKHEEVCCSQIKVQEINHGATNNYPAINNKTHGCYLLNNRHRMTPLGKLFYRRINYSALGSKQNMHVSL